MGGLQDIYDAEGVKDLQEIYEDCEWGMRTGVPSICTNKDCKYMTDLEPDARKCKCPECGTQTVDSAYVLAGII